MSGGGENTTVSSNQPPQQFLDAYENVLGQAQQVASQTMPTYTGNLVAGFSPEQTSAINTVNSAQGIATPYINAAAENFNTATQPLWSNVQQFSPEAVQQYESPYTGQVVKATQQQFANTNAQQQSALKGNAVAQGAFGGDRAAVAQSVLAGQQQASEAPVIANLENQGYSQALQEFNTQQGSQLGANEANAWLNSQAAFGLGNLGQEAQNTALSGASAQLQTGALEQQLAQEQLNVPYEQWLQQVAAPFQQTSWLAGIAEGTGSASGGTGTSSSTSTPSALSTVTGLGMTGLGAAELLGFLSGGAVPRAGGGGIALPDVPDVSLDIIPQSQAPITRNTIPNPQSQQDIAGADTRLSVGDLASLGKFLRGRSGGLSSDPYDVGGTLKDFDSAAMADETSWVPARRGGGIAGNDNWEPVPQRATGTYGGGGIAAYAAGGGTGADVGGQGGVISVTMAPVKAGSPMPVMSFQPSTGNGGVGADSGLPTADQAYFTNNLARTSTAEPNVYQPDFVTPSTSVASKATAAANAAAESRGNATSPYGANNGFQYSGGPQNPQATWGSGAFEPGGTYSGVPSTPASLSDIGSAIAGIPSGIAGAVGSLFGGGSYGDTGIAPATGSLGDGTGGMSGGAAPGEGMGSPGGSEGGVARGGRIERHADGDTVGEDLPLPPEYVPPPDNRTASEPAAASGIAGTETAPSNAGSYAVNYMPRTVGDPEETARIRRNAPGLGLLAAGLGILGGHSTNGVANIGNGALEGLKLYAGEMGRADQMQERQNEAADTGSYRKAELDLHATQLSDAADQAKQRIAQEDRHLTQEAAYQQGELGLRGAELGIQRDRLAQEGWTSQPAQQTDKDGNPVNGVLRVNTHTGEQQFVPTPGVTTLAWQKQDDTRSWRDTRGSQADQRLALETRRVGLSETHYQWLEGNAASKEEMEAALRIYGANVQRDPVTGVPTPKIDLGTALEQARRLRAGTGNQPGAAPAPAQQPATSADGKPPLSTIFGQ
jgi:hypothetical protein